MIFPVGTFVYYVPLYLRGRTIHEVGGKVMIGSFIHEVAVIDGWLCSRCYGIVFLCSLNKRVHTSVVLFYCFQTVNNSIVYYTSSSLLLNSALIQFCLNLRKDVD